MRLLRLSHNQLSGEIPAELARLSNLNSLDLGTNQLSGEIPVDLGGLSKLRSIRLSNNRLTGAIPPELANLSDLERLYLDDNELTGEIPMALSALSNLRELYLGGNSLTGCIPVGPQNIEYNDLGELGLPVCTDPAPSSDLCIEPLAGSRVDGMWDGDCESSERSGSYARFYRFTIADSADVTITLVSAVDPFLYVRDGLRRNGTVLHVNDDYDTADFSLDSTTDSGIRARLEPGAYTIEATTFDAQTGGNFTLRVEGVNTSP